jgi:hypothetical protein
VLLLLLLLLLLLGPLWWPGCAPLGCHVLLKNAGYEQLCHGTLQAHIRSSNGN